MVIVMAATLTSDKTGVETREKTLLALLSEEPLLLKPDDVVPVVYAILSTKLMRQMRIVMTTRMI